MDEIREGTWVHDLVAVYNELGGAASYRDVYPLAKRRRLERGASWTAQSEASIRRTVEDHAASSSNFRGKEVFYSVNGHGRGMWALMPQYLSNRPASPAGEPAYLEGLEGLLREQSYLRRSRDPRLVEARKACDDYTCQACGFRLDVGGGKFIIDVHHINPLGTLSGIRITKLEDLVCLCPTCHRIAHSRAISPLSLEEIIGLVKPSNG